MRLINNFQVFRAQELARKGDFVKAKKIVRNLVSRYPQSVGFHLLLADIEMFSGDLVEALKQYKTAKKCVELEPKLSKRNRRFLSAYANFRTIAVESHRTGKDWSEWREVAKAVEELDADKRFKRVFKLPT